MAVAPSSADRRGFQCSLAAILTLLALMAAPLLMGRMFVADDLGEFHLPLRQFYAQQLERGEAFDWMPSLFAGFYVTGEGQLGAYHPLHLILYRLLPLQAAFGLEVLLSYPVMLLGMYLLLKRELGSRAAALFGAMVFTFSGFCLLHFVHVNAIAVVAHLPWLLLAGSIGLSSPTARHRAFALLAIGALTASQLLLGYPQYVWFTWILGGAYLAWNSGLRRDTWPKLADIGLFVTLGVLAGAVQLLPTLDALSTSTRAAADSEFSTSGSLHPLNLIQLLAPYLFQTRVVGQNTHELGLYIGAVPLALCAWLLCSKTSSRISRRAAWAAALLAVFALLLAFGGYSPLGQLQAWLPVVDRFRFPCRAVVIVHFALAVLAAIAMVEMTRRRDGEIVQSLRSLAPVWICAAVSCLAAVVGASLWPQFVARPLLIATGPALFGIAALLITYAVRGSRVALSTLMIFTAFDLGMYGLSYSVYGKTSSIEAYAASRSPVHPGQRVAAAPDIALAPGVAVPAMGNRVLLSGAERVDGYAGLNPLRTLDYTQANCLRLASTEWLITQGGSDEQLVPVLPRVRLVARTAPLSALAAGKAPPANIAYCDPPLQLPASAPGEVTVLTSRPGDWVLRTTAPDRQLLVVTESFHSGWTATVDGQSARVLRVNGDFMGCEVGAGSHLVELRFQPLSLQTGLTTTILGVSLMLCFFGIRVHRSQRSA